MKLAHIINPVAVQGSSDLFIAQPITFETMKVARNFAIKKYKFYHDFIGTPPIGKSIALNLISNSKNFKEFKDLHLTFHLGNDKNWLKDLRGKVNISP